MNLFLRILVVLLLEVTLGLGYALADCTRDRNGVVFCSQHPGGGAVRDNSGQVVCGNGQCRRDRAGNVRCSNQVGGGAKLITPAPLNVSADARLHRTTSARRPRNK